MRLKTLVVNIFVAAVFGMHDTLVPVSGYYPSHE
jgi:hypothetical protein